MAEKLRKKFIIVSVSSVLVVIFIIAGLINLSNYGQIHRRADELLQILTENDGYFPKENREDKNRGMPAGISKEAPFFTRFFTIKTDEQGNITTVDTGKVSAISTAEAIEYGVEALGKTNSEGLIDHYKFAKVEQPYGNLLVFVDCSRDFQFFYDSLKTSLFISFAGVVGVFILVFFLSKKAVAPVVESYEKQKEFITNVSHELKTPLAIIKANTEVLEIDGGETQWSRCIHNQVNRLNVLVGSLISLSQMEEAKEVFEKSEFLLSNIIQEMAMHFQILAASENKTIRTEIQEGITYFGDEAQIMQLVSIILDNGVKYARTETEIRLKLQRHGKRILLEMSNFAEGLSVGDYEMLFERFYRLDGSRNSQSGGTGIGLSVAKSIVARHKGKISARSIDGKILTISILL